MRCRGSRGAATKVSSWAWDSFDPEGFETFITSPRREALAGVRAPAPDFTMLSKRTITPSASDQFDDIRQALGGNGVVSHI